MIDELTAINQSIGLLDRSYLGKISLTGKDALELLDQLNLLDGKLIGDKAFQITRVESGMPDWSTEITQDYNPLEARLIHAISFTKGCYTGQEVIARLDTYDKVQKYLMIIELTKNVVYLALNLILVVCICPSRWYFSST